MTRTDRRGIPILDGATTAVALALASILAMLLVACGGAEEPPSPAAAGQPEATPTVEAMMEEAPATPDPIPTSTPRPTATPWPTATPNLEPTPVVLGDCRDGMRLQPGEGCRYTGGGSPQANVVLSVQNDGAICRKGGPAKQEIGSITINVNILCLCSSGGFERDDAFQSEIVASENPDGSWTFYESALSASASTSTPTAAPTLTPAPPLNVYESGQTIPDFPSGLPNVVRGGASLQIVGENVVITMSDGGTVEYSHATYTCVSGGECRMENGRVTAGAIRVSEPAAAEKPTPIPTATPTPEPTVTSIPTPTATPMATPMPAPGGVLIFMHEFFGIHFELKVLEVVRGYAGDEDSDFWLDIGNEWVKVVIEVKNPGEEDYSSLSPLTFALVDANYSELGDAFGAPDTGNLIEDKEIASGATVWGDIFCKLRSATLFWPLRWRQYSSMRNTCT